MEREVLFLLVVLREGGTPLSQALVHTHSSSFPCPCRCHRHCQLPCPCQNSYTELRCISYRGHGVDGGKGVGSHGRTDHDQWRRDGTWRDWQTTGRQDD